jgi:glycosyltransferase involved in cell wall biosynthesis
LLIHNHYQQPGGESVAVMALKSLLEQKNHEVLFFSADNKTLDLYDLPNKIQFFPRAVFSQQTYRRIRQLVDQEKPDMAHVHNVFPLISPSVYLALDEAGIPIVQTVHNYRLMCINGLFLRGGNVCERCKNGNFFSGFRFRCYRSSYALSGLYALTIGMHRSWGTFSRIDRYITPTRFVAQKLIESGLVKLPKISVLGNFLNTPLPECGMPNLREPYIVYVGRLSQEKGLLTIVNVVRQMPHLRLKLMGKGPLEKDIRAYIQDQGIRNVEMLGFMDGEAKYQTLRNALCCIIPSEWYEVMPFSVLESAAVGTPIVASRIGSLATLVAQGETGLLFAPGDSADLKEKLEFLVSKPEAAVQMGQQARQWVETDFTSDAHYEALMKIYAQAAS